MSRHLAELGRPLTAGLPLQVRDLLAEELTIVVIAMREQANLWRAARTPGLETAIVAFGDFADVVQQRARAYRNPSSA
ncbi:hypothetical protein [Amycolatopsis sp. ATCC 39116]|uniref:hypothetical protein n=1 Tax=Amycolatopsis sp. (strain ATCC 39116 / 75iv2) TaxID=385957 RepID=UPI0012FC38A3|nr:hypothetical protein [Amycolatopsis sp. ATCC 39116]